VLPLPIPLRVQLAAQPGGRVDGAGASRHSGSGPGRSKRWRVVQ
jgi:hypothetical protein